MWTPANLHMTASKWHPLQVSHLGLDTKESQASCSHKVTHMAQASGIITKTLPSIKNPNNKARWDF